MSEELGKVEKPTVEEYEKGRKLYFIPLIQCGKESPIDYLERFNRYWQQIEDQLAGLEEKLGMVSKVYHELITISGEEGCKSIKELNDKSYEVAKSRLDKGAQLFVIENSDLLMESIDWSICLSLGLQSEKVVSTIYQYYTEALKKRNEIISRQIDETLKENEIGILFMREEHQVQFPSDIRVFYVAPPALDEIKRWLRDHASKQQPEA